MNEKFRDRQFEDELSKESKLTQQQLKTKHALTSLIQELEQGSKEKKSLDELINENYIGIDHEGRIMHLSDYYRDYIDFNHFQPVKLSEHVQQIHTSLPELEKISTDTSGKTHLLHLGARALPLTQRPLPALNAFAEAHKDDLSVDVAYFEAEGGEIFNYLRERFEQPELALILPTVIAIRNGAVVTTHNGGYIQSDLEKLVTH